LASQLAAYWDGQADKCNKHAEKQDMEQQRTVTPIGTFNSMGGDTSCHIIGWGYTAYPPDYENDPQIIVEKPQGTFVRAGIAIDLTIPGDKDGDIPVYAERDGGEDGALRRIIVDATRWIEEGQAPPP